MKNGKKPIPIKPCKGCPNPEKCKAIGRCMKAK